MKNILLITVFICLAFAVNAQHGAAPSENVKKEIAILKNADLDLTDVQLSRITSVLVGEEANKIRLQKTFEGNKSQLELRLKDLHANKIGNIKGGMSPQQAEKFDALKLADKF